MSGNKSGITQAGADLLRNIPYQGFEVTDEDGLLERQALEEKAMATDVVSQVFEGQLRKFYRRMEKTLVRKERSRG